MDDGPLIIDADADYTPAIEIFMAGGIIAYPTETFYGLCVNPFNADAVQALYRLKGRPSSNSHRVPTTMSPLMEVGMTHSYSSGDSRIRTAPWR